MNISNNMSKIGIASNQNPRSQQPTPKDNLAFKGLICNDAPIVQVINHFVGIANDVGKNPKEKALYENLMVKAMESLFKAAKKSAANLSIYSKRNSVDLFVEIPNPEINRTLLGVNIWGDTPTKNFEKSANFITKATALLKKHTPEYIEKLISKEEKAIAEIDSMDSATEKTKKFLIKEYGQNDNAIFEKRAIQKANTNRGSDSADKT